MDETTLEQLNQLNDGNLELLSSLSPWTLVGGLLFGIIGIWLFRKGKKQTNHKVMVIGLLLMIYPIFTMNPLPVWGIGTALCGLAYYWRE